MQVTSAKRPSAAGRAPTATDAPTTTDAEATHQADSDHDSDNNDDDYRYGEAASPTDRRLIGEVVARYYAAAAADNGAIGCSLMYSLFAEEIPEVYGEVPGPPELRGATCAAVMSKYFEIYHRQLTSDRETLEMKSVRVKRNRALAIMSFKTMPQRDILVHREYGSWKIDEMLDSNLG